MNRDLDALKKYQFDLVIIGGGIFGACCAWDAVLRGLTVALVERADFGGQTSANCFKMVHGGIRYMQHGDIVRVRESCRERSALLRVAPHLVEPLPIAIPTFGNGKNGKALLAAGMWGYDAITADRNRGIEDPTRHIPLGRFLSRSELLDDFPNVERPDLTGAAVFHDAQMYSPARLVLSFLRSAHEKGVVMANYAEATDLKVTGGQICGLDVEDVLSNEKFTIKTKAVINAAGGYSKTLFRRWFAKEKQEQHTFSRDACFVVKRRFSSNHAIALMGESHDSDALMARGARHIFVSPWRDASLIGVWHKVHKKDPSDLTVDDEELERFIKEMNGAYPGLDLELDDVRLWHAGLLPFGDEAEDGKELSYGKRSILIDHSREHNIGGLVSLIGIRYTMGRGDAARAVDLLLKSLNKRTRRPDTHKIPVFGGKIGIFEDLVSQIQNEAGFNATEPVARALAHNYGSEYRDIFSCADGDAALLEPLPGTHVTSAEILHAVRREQVIQLSDVVFRRTDLATAGDPGCEALDACAQIVGDELNWSASRKQQELDRLRPCFPGFPLSSRPLPSGSDQNELIHENPVL